MFIITAGEQLPKKFENEAIEWLTEKYPNFVGFLLQFQIQDEEMFPKMMFSESVLKLSAQKWWSINAKKSNDPDFADFSSFLAKLHSIPASSASIERLFSTFSLVWSKLRNKLGAEKVAKLVKIYRFLNKN